MESPTVLYIDDLPQALELRRLWNLMAIPSRSRRAATLR